MIPAFSSHAKKIDDWVDMTTKWVLAICVFFMLSLTLTNIVLRWFEHSIHWIEPLVRHLVFISAFLGGSLATGSRHNIKIDLASKIIKEEKWNKLLDRAVTIVTIIAVYFLIKSGIGLGKVEFEFGKPAFLGIHSGYLVSLIPIGAGLILLRLILRLFLPVPKTEIKGV